MKQKWKMWLEPNYGYYVFALVLFSVFSVLSEAYVLGALELAASVVLYFWFLYFRRFRHRNLKKYISSISQLETEGRSADCPLPMAMIRLGDGNIIWTNSQFDHSMGYEEKLRDRKITELMPGFDGAWLVSGKKEYAYDVAVNNHRYRIFGSAFRGSDADGTLYGMVYFTDLTELYQIRDEYIRSRPVISIILVDNYDELIKNLPESAVSSLNANIDGVVTAWAEQLHGLLRHIDKNRYFLLFERRYLKLAVDSKFSILEDIHQVTNPSGLQASVSVGVGLDGQSYEEAYSNAALSIEMALSRGGEQAVIKNRYEFAFYGEGGRKTQRNNRVRSRVTANSLMELIQQADHVFVMGHRNADLDSLGAAVGIVCMARKKGKKASIVLDQERNALGSFLQEFMQVPEYRDTFLSPQDALLKCRNSSLLIVVDTNRPDQVESTSLLEAIPKLCVIDHHRRAADYIESAVVSFHETSASSACELVTELMQYSLDAADILPIEAKAIMAGIFLDTKSFQVRTGDGTFEAAAFLKRVGAEPTDVKKLLQNDYQSTIAKYQILKSARIYRQNIAIAALNTETTRVLAAQAADELLNISGITASFVIYPQGEEVIVSARSIGDVNVQIMLEPLGGGGNAATAGAQIHGMDVKSVVDRLIEHINTAYSETVI